MFEFTLQHFVNKKNYESTLKDYYNGCVVINDFNLFNTLSDVILANRLDDTLDEVKDKVYTRDLFTRD